MRGLALALLPLAAMAQLTEDPGVNYGLADGATQWQQYTTCPEALTAILPATGETSEAMIYRRFTLTGPMESATIPPIDCTAPTVVTAVPPVTNAGALNFYMKHQGWMDNYTTDPPATPINWTAINANYTSMQVYDAYWSQNGRGNNYADGFVYKDAMAIKNYGYGFAPDFGAGANIEQWILRDAAAGNYLYVDFDCVGPAVPGGSPAAQLTQEYDPSVPGRVGCTQFAADIGDPGFRDWWILQLKAWLAATNYSGVWIDDVNMEFRISDGAGTPVLPWNPRTNAQMTLAEWRGYLADFMEEIRVEIPDKLIAHNSIFYANDGAQDVNIDRAIVASNYFNLERGIVDSGLVGDSGDPKFQVRTYFNFIDYVHNLGRAVIQMNYNDAATAAAGGLDYALAGFLLTNDGTDMLSEGHTADAEQWAAPDSSQGGAWDAARWEIDLGNAIGQRYNWLQFIRRDFDNGSVVLNLPGADTEPLVVDGVVVTVGAKQAVIGMQISEPEAVPSTLYWDAPTTNTDGSPLTDLSHYEVRQNAVFLGVTTNTYYDVTGNHCWSVFAVDESGNYSTETVELCN